MSSLPTQSPNQEPRKLKILMLHGYTQSGPLFHAKTRALEKSLQKAFPAANLPVFNTIINPSSSTTPSNASTKLYPIQKPKPLLQGVLPLYPGGIELIYPSGPLKLSPSQIPGYNAAKTSGLGGNELQNEVDTRAWWTRNDRTGEYDGLEDGLDAIASAIQDAGPDGIVGVIGFSQGGAAAAFVASLLQPGRLEAFQSPPESLARLQTYPQLRAENQRIRYPPSFTPLSSTTTTSSLTFQPHLKFFISYSGFLAPSPSYSAFYNPPINTPSLHFIGSLDTVVEESRSLALAENCTDSKIVYHPGGHFVPIGREYVATLIGFIRMCCSEVTQGGSEVGEGLDINLL